ncbi:quinone-dependent dihydroorotate dehydrogenase [Sphingoaurantiacus capsulatus]|uniref:Dihydroorotate dehydrogenase (quinone) n=1 Tax=Sphingoaurantiacus capsulatus TaxID=1771310 RepID=A0ABV7XCX8_9SPHN
MLAYALARPLLFALDPEVAHGLTVKALKLGLLPPAAPDDPILATTLAGLNLPNPIGLAAGFDKNAEVPDAMLGLGFGFVEAGTVTPLPQVGNPKPRMFRLVEDRGVINRLGFNNEGLDAYVARLRDRAGRPGIVGANVGANKDAVDRIADYETGVRAVRGLAGYITVNISSPNTPGLRALQSREALAELIERSLAARGEGGPPIFVKVAPDLTEEDIRDIAEVSLAGGIDGLIVSNTTIARDGLRSAKAGETGGLSGAPLFERSTRVLREFRAATGARLPLIGAGGVASGADAYAKIRAGASAVQLYSMLVYEGPGLVARIKEELLTLLQRDGFPSVDTAVGSDA